MVELSCKTPIFTLLSLIKTALHAMNLAFARHAPCGLGALTRFPPRGRYRVARNFMAIQRVNVLGVGISVLNLKSALAAIAEAVTQRRKGYICITGVHGVMEAQDNPEFRRILNGAFLCTPDGMPMV